MAARRVWPAIPCLLLLTAQLAAGADTVVLCRPQDPYRTLAEEMARHEGCVLADDLSEALAHGPLFLLWVVSPGRLSDRALARFGRALGEAAEPVAAGIITGSTQESARRLWGRRAGAGGGGVFVANGEQPTAGFPRGRLREVSDHASSAQPLTRDTLTRALAGAGYLSFTGHGASGYWRLAGQTTFGATDVPRVPPLLVGTASCQTLRPWRPDSISLAFVERGAAGYAGFPWSPLAGYLMGAYDGLPFRGTWPEIPVGLVVSLQNRGTLQGFARFPSYTLLGDPRLVLLETPPYRLDTDETTAGGRRLGLSAAPAGVVPILVRGGARYACVELPGETVACRGEPFYNSRLQMLDRGEDKFVLVEHRGGALTLELHREAAWHRTVADALSDSLEHTLIYSQERGGAFLGVVVGSLALVVRLWRARRGREWPLGLLPALSAGLAAAVLHLGYVALRLPQLTVGSKSVGLSPLTPLASFLLVGSGALLYLEAQTLRRKLAALLLATSPAWVQAGFCLAAILLFNRLAARPVLGTALYNYNLGLMPLVAFASGAAVLGLLFMLLGRLRASWERRTGAGVVPPPAP